MFTLRFDMRAPQPGVEPADLYAAALDMCAWADEGGDCATVVICEHHGSPDGYLPSPFVLGSAVAARTKQVGILLAAVLIPFYDPIRLAEDMNVLDLVSRGRASFVLGIAYRPEEFEQFGVDRRRRGKIAEAKLELLMSLRTGEEIEYHGRRIRVTPQAFTAGGPTVMWGGGSVAAARRAGRYGLGLLANANVPGMLEAYHEECAAHGHEPGVVILPKRGRAGAVFVADDIEEAWSELGPYLHHDARMYSAWNPGDATTSFITHAASVDDLRAEGSGYAVIGTDEAAARVRDGAVLSLAPLCGGIPPAVAWPYLERAAAAVAAARSTPE